MWSILQNEFSNLIFCIYQHVPSSSLSLQCDPSATDDLGRCSLHHSSQAGAVGTTELLVREGVDHSARASTSQLTPLHYAAKVCARHVLLASYFSLMPLISVCWL